MAILKLDNSSDTFLFAGMDALDREDYSRAVAELSHAVKLDPTNIDYRVALARAYEEGGAIGEANRILTALITDYPRLSFIQEVGQNMMADGKNADAHRFMASALTSVGELRADNLQLEDLLRTGFMEQQTITETEEFDAPELVTAKSIREESLYQEILAAESEENYTDMMNLALTYRKDYAYYAEVLEIIVDHMLHTFHDEEGAIEYAKKLREVCPESAVHFEALYPKMPKGEKSRYYEDTVSAIIEYGYPDDMEQMVEVLSRLEEYPLAYETNERFLKEIPFREKLWKNKVALAFLLKKGTEVLDECKRKFPFAPFVHELEWAAVWKNKEVWKELLLGFPANEYEMEFELWRATEGFRKKNKFAVDDESILKLAGVFLRTHRDGEFYRVFAKKTLEIQGITEFFLKALCDFNVFEWYKREIINLLMEMGYNDVMTVVAHGTISRAYLCPVPAEHWVNPRCYEIYRSLTATLFMTAENVLGPMAVRAVEKLDAVPNCGNKKKNSLLAVAHSFYYDLTNRAGIFLENIANAYDVRMDTLMALRQFFLNPTDN